MKKVTVLENKVQEKIYSIRGVQIMLDKDLAELYQVKAVRLREQVKRNIERFPSDFMFQLTEKETEIMVSQNAIPSRKQLGGSLPYVFTEQGVSGVSGVLKNKLKLLKVYCKENTALLKIQTQTLALQNKTSRNQARMKLMLKNSDSSFYVSLPLLFLST